MTPFPADHAPSFAGGRNLFVTFSAIIRMTAPGKSAIMVAFNRFFRWGNPPGG